MKKIGFALVLAVVWTGGAADWICYPEPPLESVGKARYHRKPFEVRDGLVSARLHFVIDDSGEAWIDGKAVPPELAVAEPSPEGECHKLYHPRHFDVTSLLGKGRHVLGYRVVNLAGRGGVVGRLNLRYADGRVEDVCSAADWKTNRTAPAGWAEVAFDDSGWGTSFLIGNTHTSPWAGIFDLSSVRTDAEQSADRAEQARRKARIEALRKRCAAERKPRVTVAYPNGRAAVLLDGEPCAPIIYRMSDAETATEQDFTRRQIADFAEGGIHLFGHTVDCRIFWRRDGSIDVGYLEREVERVLEIDPEARLLVGIDLYVPPDWWLDAHPDECVDYANGGIDPRETDTLRRCRAPSYASEVWRRDACAAIRRVVAALEASPLASRIFAYRLDSGVYTEWHYYGMADGMPDCSRPMTDCFRDWLKRRYADDRALQTAWGRTDATRETAVTPPKAIRVMTGAGDFRDAKRDRWTLDFLACQGEAVRDCLLAFDRAAKEACGGRALVGNFSGYFFCMTFPAEGWHLANDEILDSPFVDFQSAPVAYGEQFRGVGGTGQVRALVDSFRLRGKLCLLEADTRTQLEPQDGHVFVKNDAESLAVLSRDMASMLVHGCGLWYFDFGHGWYTTPALRDYLHGLNVFRDLKGDFGSVAEVAVVGDYDSVPYHAREVQPAPATAVGIDETIRELGFCGVAYDLLSFPDLARANARDYKVYVFLNLYHLTDEKRRVLDRLKREGHALVWVSTPGWPDGGAAAVAEATGIACGVEPRRTALKLELAGGGEAKPELEGASVASVVVPEDAQAQTWATVRTATGESRACISMKKQAGGWRSILCGLPYMPRELFLRLFAEMGVHRHCADAGAVVYANASIVAVHAAKAGTYRVRTPESVRWRRIYPDGEKSAGPACREREVRMTGPGTVVFKVEK